ncbi:E3 ubiquitin-protein ligase synoviolin, partial [Blomia tropicalis]
VMALTLNGLAAVNAVILVSDIIYEYFYQQNQFYSILLAMHRNARMRTLLTTQLVLGIFVFYRLITWLIFGQLSRAELDYIKENRWSIFTELVTTFIIFQPLNSVSSFIHFMFMYYLMLTTILLEKRIETLQMLDEGATTNSQSDSQKDHQRVALAIGLLYLCNAFVIRYYCKNQLLKNGSLSLLTAVTMHRYIVSSALLSRAILSYLLNLIESAFYQSEWDEKQLYSSIINLMVCGTIALSNLSIVARLIQMRLRAISLIRMFIRNLYSCVPSSMLKTVGSNKSSMSLMSQRVVNICTQQQQQISHKNVITTGT